MENLQNASRFLLSSGLGQAQQYNAANRIPLSHGKVAEVFVVCDQHSLFLRSERDYLLILRTTRDFHYPCHIIAPCTQSLHYGSLYALICKKARHGVPVRIRSSFLSASAAYASAARIPSRVRWG